MIFSYTAGQPRIMIVGYILQKARKNIFNVFIIRDKC